MTSETEARSGYTLPPPSGPLREIAVGWLWLGLIALLVSGIFVVLVVASRTPYVQELIPWKDFFHTAIVVHVDLSVLVWFLAFAGVLWSHNARPHWLNLSRSALGLAGAGTLVVAAAPFFGAKGALMSNYVVILQDPLFFLGLGLLGLGFSLLILHTLMAARPVGIRATGEGVLRFGLHAALVTSALSVGAFIWSYLAIPGYFGGKELYELLFWGGGHTLQYTHILLMLVAWLWLGALSGLDEAIPPRAGLVVITLGLLPALGTPFVYLAFPIESPEHREALTWLMQAGGGLAALPLALALLWGWRATPRGPLPEGAPAARSALVASVGLFGAGGLIGFLIADSDVTVPAHYHGSIVAVTLAFMGLTYQLLPRFGLGTAPRRLAILQPALYGAGQLLHVLGLTWSGLNGVQRKTAGARQGLDTFSEIAGMALMGLGGLVAIVGGVLFLVVVLMAVRHRASGSEEAPEHLEHQQG